MTVNFNKPAFKLREALTQLKKKSGVFGETLLRTNTASEAHTVLGTTGKNLFINGAMEINQRGATSLTSGGFLLDRWKYNYSNYSGAFTQSVQDDAPEGFTKSFKFLTTTGAAIPAGGYHYFSQIIERNNCAHLNYNTYNAKPVTVSFWIKGNITGTYALTLYNWQANRSINRSYTITRPGVWEKKTVTFPGDITGALTAGTGQGLELYFILGVGASYKGSIANDWVGYSGTYFGGAQTADVGATTGGYWQITGIQMEAGTAATPFERRSYGQELALCQRYWFNIIGNSNGTGAFTLGFAWSTSELGSVIRFPVPMRSTSPTLVQSTGTDYYAFEGNATNKTFSQFTAIARPSDSSGYLYTGLGGVLTTGTAGELRTNNSNAYLAVNAEL